MGVGKVGVVEVECEEVECEKYHTLAQELDTWDDEEDIKVGTWVYPNHQEVAMMVEDMNAWDLYNLYHETIQVAMMRLQTQQDSEEPAMGPDIDAAEATSHDLDLLFASLCTPKLHLGTYGCLYPVDNV